MRKIIFTLSLTSILFLTGCGNSTSNSLIGKWSSDGCLRQDKVEMFVSSDDGEIFIIQLVYVNGNKRGDGHKFTGALEGNKISAENNYFMRPKTLLYSDKSEAIQFMECTFNKEK